MIIAFTGLMGSGKTTAADYLVQNYGFQKINFKDALVAEMKDRLRDTLEALFQRDYDGTSIDSIDDMFRVKKPIMRALMQNYGTEVRRRDNPNYWVDAWKASVLGSETKDVVVDDCRFLNEAGAVKELGGRIIRINRTDIVRAGDHPSETEQFNIAHDLDLTCNKGEQELLFKLVADYVDYEKARE